MPRLHQLRQENGLTRHKMHLLREEMKARRMRRQSRRDAAAPYSKQVSDESQCLSHMSVKQSSTNDVETVSSSDLDVSIASHDQILLFYSSFSLLLISSLTSLLYFSLHNLQSLRAKQSVAKISFACVSSAIKIT